MAGLSVDVEGDERLRKALSGVTGLMKNLRPPLREIARGLRRRADLQFQTRGQAYNTPWPSRSPATMRARRRGWGYYGTKGASGGPVQASGETRRSFTSPSSTKHVEKITRQTMEWGSKHPLAHLHTQGPQNRGPAPPLPQRPIIAFKFKKERDDFFREPIEEHVFDDLG